MDKVFVFDPWASAARSLRPCCAQVPGLLFAAPTKQAMAIAEGLLGTQVAGLGDAATKLSKLNIPDGTKNVLNKTTKMLRILNEANNLERHFTAHGIAGWLGKLDSNINELGRSCASEPSSQPVVKETIAVAPSALTLPQVNEMIDQLKERFMEGIAGQRCHFQGKLNEAVDRLPSMIEARIQPLKDMVVKQNDRITELESKVENQCAGVDPEARQEVAAMIDGMFVEKFMEVFPKVINTAIKKPEDQIASIGRDIKKTDESVAKLDKEMDITRERLRNIEAELGHPPFSDDDGVSMASLHIGVRVPTPPSDEEPAAVEYSGSDGMASDEG